MLTTIWLLRRRKGAQRPGREPGDEAHEFGFRGQTVGRIQKKASRQKSPKMTSYLPYAWGSSVMDSMISVKALPISVDGVLHDLTR